MAASVKITRLDLDAAGLRAAAGLSRESAASRRMLALGLVLEGYSRTDAARLCGMDRQTLRDWVHRYNDLGLEGLTDRQYAGPKCRLSEAQQAQVRQWVEEGPDLKAHGVVRWRRIDLSRRIETEFGVRLVARSVGTLLRRMGLRRLSVRPRHLGHDAEAQAAHKKTSPIWSLRRSPSRHEAGR